ncbi:MAG: dynamin family protein [Bacteroidaceae bacterium]|nr:dynamin family protein [Bacteroidaceae bacterium]
MEKENNIFSRFNRLREIIQNGSSMGIELTGVLKKINNVLDTINSGEINIALIGSFSDGKTSAIAGLFGEVLSNMKIAADESSDEISIYRYNALGKNFRIVDTPGLFGTKEKEIEGKEVRFSDITTKYLSEAHVVIYVCDAVNPLKESHAGTIRHIMRDLGKLDSSIFVINKMDEAGYDLTDEADFKRGKEIKIATLKERLKESLNLTGKETDDLHIVCIAADPKGKGIENWFAKMQDYLLRSHITDFKETLDKVVSRCDKDNMNSNVEKASVIEMVKEADESIDNIYLPCKSSLARLKEDSMEMNVNMDIMHAELVNSRNLMIKRLDDLKNDILHKIDGADINTIRTIIQDDLGVQGDTVTMYILERNINMILSDCSENNKVSISVNSVKISKKIEEESAWIEEQVRKGVQLLGKTQIDENMVGETCKVLANTYKFKPWEAIKVSEKLAKWLGRAGIAISVALEVWEWVKEYKNVCEYSELKKELLSTINDAFADVARTFGSDGDYYSNYAPNYIALKESLKKRDEEILLLENQIAQYKELKEKLSSWSKDAEYIDFEEVEDSNDNG